MGDVKNLQHSEAIQKLKDVAKELNICLFCTNVHELPFRTRPMSVLDVDDAGNLWFFSNKFSNKDHELKQDAKVQLLFADNDNMTYMTVYGHADVFYDRYKVEELWAPIAKTWFTEGKTDPDLEIIRVRPEDAYYWDTKNGKMISFLKILAGAVTGKTMDDGIEGRMDM